MEKQLGKGHLLDYLGGQNTDHEQYTSVVDILNNPKYNLEDKLSLIIYRSLGFFEVPKLAVILSELLLDTELRFGNTMLGMEELERSLRHIKRSKERVDDNELKQLILNQKNSAWYDGYCTKNRVQENPQLLLQYVAHCCLKAQNIAETKSYTEDIAILVTAYINDNYKIIEAVEKYLNSLPQTQDNEPRTNKIRLRK